MISPRFLLALTVSAALLSGCGTAACDKPSPYQNSPDLPPLRVPADLDAPDPNTGLALPEVSEAARQKTKPCRDRPPVIARADRPAAPAEPVMADTELAERARTRGEERARAEVRETLARWNEDWNEGDLDAFLAHYGVNFTPPDGAAAAEWRAAHERRMAAGERIEIDMDSLSIEVAGNDGAHAEFLQDSVNGEQTVRVRKRLDMQRGPLGWRIDAERIQDIL